MRRKRYMDWDVQDPAGLPLANVRAIRDDIARRVNELLLELDHTGAVVGLPGACWVPELP